MKPWWSIITLLLLCLPSAVAGQELKREYEKSIRKSAMPAPALELAKVFLEEGERIRYYFEHNGDTVFYEIKLWWQGRHLSIEFTSAGELIDIEELLEMEAVESHTATAIQRYFEGKFKRHHIDRFQKQYSSAQAAKVLAAIQKGEFDGVAINYEVEANVKGDDWFGPYEFLFDDQGNLQKTRKIEKRASDNLRY